MCHVCWKKRKTWLSVEGGSLRCLEVILLVYWATKGKKIASLEVIRRLEHVYAANA